jgi:hypothetical protein
MAEPRTNVDSKTERRESLAYIVEEQRRDYDYLLHIYNRMRATEGLLLTATFGIVAYLYYSGKDGSILDRLTIPAEDYGKIIYLIAGSFFFYGLIKLMINVFGRNPWETVYQSNKTDYSYKPMETLEYIKNRHDECQKCNGDQYNKRKNELGFLFYCILISAIILIVIKTLS